MTKPKSRLQAKTPKGRQMGATDLTDVERGTIVALRKLTLPVTIGGVGRGRGRKVQLGYGLIAKVTDTDTLVVFLCSANLANCRNRDRSV